MASTQQTRDELNAAIAEAGRQVVANPGAGTGLTAEQVALLRDAGIADNVLGHILREEGLDESEVAGYLLNAPTTTSPNIVVFTECVGQTCKSITIVIGCTISVPPIR
jgi:hypothetical protein